VKYVSWGENTRATNPYTRKSESEALDGPEGFKWKGVRQKELKSQVDPHTWTDGILYGSAQRDDVLLHIFSRAVRDTGKVSACKSSNELNDPVPVLGPLLAISISLSISSGKLEGLMDVSYNSHRPALSTNQTEPLIDSSDSASLA
jgi:hypothetical protein